MLNDYSVFESHDTNILARSLCVSLARALARALSEIRQSVPFYEWHSWIRAQLRDLKALSVPQDDDEVSRSLARLLALSPISFERDFFFFEREACSRSRTRTRALSLSFFVALSLSHSLARSLQLQLPLSLFDGPLPAPGRGPRLPRLFPRVQRESERERTREREREREIHLPTYSLSHTSISPSLPSPLSSSQEAFLESEMLGVQGLSDSDVGVLLDDRLPGLGFRV